MREAEQDNDRVLIGLALDGDDDAFRRIVQRYQRVVFACAFTMARDADDAADLCQEAFIRFHRNLRQYDASRPLKPYLLTITMNCTRNLLRKRSRMAWTDGEESAQLHRLADTRPSPEKRALKAERYHAVRQFVDALPTRLREVCSLFYLAERSCREIAGMLRMSETAVKVALHRARKRLLDSGIREWRTL